MNKQKYIKKEKRSPHLILYLILKRIIEQAYIYIYYIVNNVPKIDIWVDWLYLWKCIWKMKMNVNINTSAKARLIYYIEFLQIFVR